MSHENINTNIDPLLWHESSPGRWERELDELELFYVTLARLFEGSGRSFFSITGHVSISLPSDSVSQLESKQAQRIEAAFRKAWTQLRYDHPALASTVQYDGESKKCVKVYHTPTTIDEEAEWLSSSFETINNGQTGDQISNADPPVKSHATLFLITPPVLEGEEKAQRRDIIFRCHHWTIDGIGTLILLNNLLIHAASAYMLQDVYHPSLLDGTETANLSPSFGIAANLPRSLTEEQQNRLSEIQALKSSTKAIDSHTTILTLPFCKPIPDQLGPSQRTVLRLSAAETLTVLQKSKNLGLTPTHAFHAGIVLALRDLQPHSELASKGRYINYGLLNLRSHCSPPYDSAQHAAAVYHSVSTPLVIDVDIPKVTGPRTEDIQRREFIAVATEMKTFYQNVQSDPDHSAIILPYYSSLRPPYPEEVPEVPSPGTSPQVSISSLGVVNKIIQPEHGPFTICAGGAGPWVASDELGTGMGIYLSTWRGQIEVSAGYNAAFRSKGEANNFLEMMRRIVFEALEV